MKAALEIKGLVKHYPGFSLNHINLVIPQGCIMGLVGENGAGKSTLIKCILDIVFPQEGSVFYHGEPVKELSAEWKNEIGVVLDACRYPDHMHAIQIADVMDQIYKNWEEQAFFQLLSKFGIDKKKAIKDYSKGMKMKLQIAVALSHHAKFLILDEATSGLDPIVRDEILDLMLDFIQDEDHTILFSTHITSDLEKVADYITLLHKGNCIFTENKDELLYSHGIVCCGAEDFKQIPEEWICGIRKNSFNYEVLIKERQKCVAEHPDWAVKKASIEEIMLFMVKGEQV